MGGRGLGADWLGRLFVGFWERPCVWVVAGGLALTSSLFFSPLLPAARCRATCFGGERRWERVEGREAVHIAIIHLSSIYIHSFGARVCVYMLSSSPCSIALLLGPWAGPGGSAAAAAAFHSGGGSRPRPPPFVYIYAIGTFLYKRNGSKASQESGKGGRVYRKMRRRSIFREKGSRRRCRAERKPQRGGKTHGHGHGRGPKRMHAYVEMEKKKNGTRGCGRSRVCGY